LAINFNGKYWEYGGDVNVYDKGLTISVYESAWFADLVAAHIFERTQILFDELKYDGIYRDDGILVFQGKVRRLVNYFSRESEEPTRREVP